MERIPIPESLGQLVFGADKGEVFTDLDGTAKDG